MQYDKLKDFFVLFGSSKEDIYLKRISIYFFVKNAQPLVNRNKNILTDLKINFLFTQNGIIKKIFLIKCSKTTHLKVMFFISRK